MCDTERMESYLEIAIARARSPYGLRAIDDRDEFIAITFDGRPLCILPSAAAGELYRKLVDEWLERQER